MDGILDFGTAWLVEPYDVPVEPAYASGFEYFTAEQLRTYVDELHRVRYRINFRVIGDQAARSAIDDTPEAVADRRHRETHV